MLKQMPVVCAVMLGICAAPGTYAQASLVSQDLFASGDNLLTYDTASGLQWLNLNETLGQSYDTVVSGYMDFSTGLGFTYATEEQVSDLLSDAGVTQGNIYGYWNFSNSYYVASYNLANILGITHPFDGLWTLSLGITGTSAGPSSQVVALVGYNNHADSYSFSNYQSADISSSAADVGSFLVRGGARAVPEPFSLALLGSGLLGLGFIRHIRSKLARIENMARY